MARTRQKRSEEKRIVSPAFSQFVHHRVMEIVGIFLFAIALMLLVALISYNALDPSANFAVNVNAKNWLGSVGAYVADGLLQWLGYSAYLFVAALIAYGFRYLRGLGMPKLLRLRPLVLIPAIIGLAAILSWITPEKPHADPFVSKHYGGVIGDIAAKFFGGSLDIFGQITTFLAFVVTLVVTLLLIAYALILPFSFWKEWSIKLGAFVAFLIRKRDDNAEDVKETEAAINEDDEEEKTHQGLLGKSLAIFAAPFSRKSKKKQEPILDTEQKEDLEETIVPSIVKTAMPKKPEPAEDFAIIPASALEEDDDDMDEDFEPPFDISEPTSIKEAAQPISKPSAAKAPSAMATAKPKETATSNEDNKVAIKTDPNKPYQYPRLDMLDKAPMKADQDPEQVKRLEENAKRLEQTLGEFGVKGKIVSVRPGPVVTLYELEPAPGTRTSRVVGLADDIARQMLVGSVRVAAVPGKNVIGIEMPNDKRETVWLRTLFEHESFRQAKGKLAMALGEDIGGAPMVVDLAKMPHLLIAGTTGSGKSVAVNTMILSLLYRLKPEECRLIMIDPKMLELSVYEGIPHLLTPVVTDPMKAVVSLKWAVREMDDRYRKMAKMGVRNIAGYNARIKEALAKGETLSKDIQTGFDENGHPITESVPLDMDLMPYIVIIIDEVADLMMMGGKQDIEIAVQRLAQKARAAGLHVIMATQRPSVDVITGTIKANFPTRISFAVTSRIDSRTILGEQGAEQLLGMGDMLYMAGGGKIDRAHGPFVSDEEVEEIANHIRSQGVPQYVSAVIEEVNEDGSSANVSGGGNISDKDDLYDQALAIVVKDNKASTSYIQRRLGIGYNRAAGIIEQLEMDGVISPADRVGRRSVLIEDHTGLTEDDE
ncbi:MAG: DNA translocase FtsK [Alphaproteobacteria bacterium]